MRKKEKVLIWVVLFLLIAFGYQVKRSIVLKERFVQSQKLNVVYSNNAETLQRTILKTTHISRFESPTLSPLVATDQFDNLVLISKSFTTSVLYFRFTERNCDACYSFELNNLKRLQDVMPTSSIVCLVSFSSANAIQILRKNYGVTYPIYNIDPSLLAEFPFEAANAPYYFMSSNSNHYKWFFLPDKTQPNLTFKYYEMVQQEISFKN